MSTSSNIMNLFILGIAILLVMVAKQNIQGMPSPDGDSFVGKVPMVPIGGAPYHPQQILPGTQPYGQPMMYPQQYYPAKVPWYPETGRPCEGGGGCGATGVCQQGVCTVRDQYNTVFDIPV